MTELLARAVLARPATPFVPGNRHTSRPMLGAYVST